ncbi:hypothetical protein [Bosea sp. 117]|uniref:hypothetical protein n=1 Tax=Bosea sp. 117 TaxID=1125973 RepID=UPI0012DDA990|nr:hypothetical protein [Bosea sp. 117]
MAIFPYLRPLKGVKAEDMVREAETKQPKRVYDKGERRHKHVGKGAHPTIEFDDSQPKKWVGKCPSTLSEVERSELLNKAIAAPNGDRDLPFPKKVYVVHNGAIYEAQTSDHGRSYHGYPYKGKLSTSILSKLTAMAGKDGCSDLFDKWVDDHIERHGA